MALTRRLLSVLIALALALGTVTIAARAGGMAEAVNHGAEAAMDAGAMNAMPHAPKSCPQCGDGASMVACAQTVCAVALGILSLHAVEIAGAPPAFAVPGAQIAAGLKPLPDPPPPRTSIPG